MARRDEVFGGIEHLRNFLAEDGNAATDTMWLPIADDAGMITMKLFWSRTRLAFEVLGYLRFARSAPKLPWSFFADSREGDDPAREAFVEQVARHLQRLFSTAATRQSVPVSPKAMSVAADVTDVTGQKLVPFAFREYSLEELVDAVENVRDYLVFGIEGRVRLVLQSPKLPGLSALEFTENGLRVELVRRGTSTVLSSRVEGSVRSRVAEAMQQVCAVRPLRVSVHVSEIPAVCVGC